MRCASAIGAVTLLLLAADVGGLVAAEGGCTVSVPPLILTAGPGAQGLPPMSAGEIALDCPKGLPVQVKIGPSERGGGAGFSPRRMVWSAGSATLAYNLYLDPGATMIWGDGTGKTRFFTGTGKGTRQSLPVYGRILPQRPAPREGVYRDSLLVTVEW